MVAVTPALPIVIVVTTAALGLARRAATPRLRPIPVRTRDGQRSNVQPRR